MSRISEDVHLTVPVTTAFTAWSDFPSFASFLDDVDSVEETGTDTTRWEASIGGQKVVFTAVVTETVPDQRIAWTSTGGDVDHAGVATFTADGSEGSTLSVTIEWQPEGLGERLGSIAGVPKVAIKRQLDQFKKHVEHEAD